MVVADAAALLEYLFRTEMAGPIGEVLRAPGADLHVPALCDVEVAAGIRRALLRKVLRRGRAEAALTDYLDLPLTRHGHRSLLPRILDLRANFSAYDACYAALAERLGGSLVTADRRLSRAAREHTAVEVLPA
ncbi:MAG: type II toxin-antitoxin system VapC family toxin [Acidobacteria bacterium]|nr:type II toxin-antitoxin system VapC family toxin [Acidobacteriota bacterium]